MEATSFRVIAPLSDDEPRSSLTTPPPLAGLVIDVCGVLYDDSSWRRWLYQLVSRMGLHTNFQAFFRVWEHDYLPAAAKSADCYWHSLRSFLTAAGLSRGQIDEIEVAGHARRRRTEESIRPLPFVTTTLAKLAAHRLPLAAVAAAPLTTAELHTNLSRLGIADCFATVVAELDQVRQAPCHDGFATALDAMRLSPREVGYVGRCALQLRRAAERGLFTIAFNYDADAEAEVYLEQFDHLLSAVRVDQSAAA